MQSLFVHHIVHPVVLAGKGEPKDVGSLERYQGTKTSERKCPKAKRVINKTFSQFIMKRTGSRQIRERL